MKSRIKPPVSASKKYKRILAKREKRMGRFAAGKEWLLSLPKDQKGYRKSIDSGINAFFEAKAKGKSFREGSEGYLFIQPQGFIELLRQTGFCGESS